MVDDWFLNWLTEHLARHPYVGLPPVETDEGSAVYGAWRTNFIRRGVHDRDVADVASEQLAGEQIKGPRDHFPRLVEIAVGVYATRQAAGSIGTAPDSREAAALASRGCEHCGGGGMAVVYRPSPRHPDCRRCGAPLSPDCVCRECHPGAALVPPVVSAHCVCPSGRWLRGRLESSCPDELRRVPDLVNVLAGRSVWRADPPAEPAALLTPTWPEMQAANREREAAAAPTPTPEVVAADPILAKEPAAF